ncbi:MAG: PLDc N-terminal domain-containing protein [Gemmatimonadetes bacterium]|nr:PLDc N-terminal domain-containing protein [Gemmatimonadota bacterium]
MRAGLALIVLVLNVFAIVSILGARRGAGARIAWLAAVVLLPVVGAVGWFIAGRAHRV